jgi:hypothetical protein
MGEGRGIPEVFDPICGTTDKTGKAGTARQTVRNNPCATIEKCGTRASRR